MKLSSLLWKENYHAAQKLDEGDVSSRLLALHCVEAWAVGNKGKTLQLCRKLGEGEVILGTALVAYMGEVPVHRVVFHNGDPRQGRCTLPEHKLCAGGRVGRVGVKGGVSGGGGGMRGGGGGVLHSVNRGCFLSGCSLGPKVSPREVVRYRRDGGLVDGGILSATVCVVSPLCIIDCILLCHIGQRVLGFPQGGSKTGVIVPDINLA